MHNIYPCLRTEFSKLNPEIAIILTSTLNSSNSIKLFNLQVLISYIYFSMESVENNLLWSIQAALRLKSNLKRFLIIKKKHDCVPRSYEDINTLKIYIKKNLNKVFYSNILLDIYLHIFLLDNWFWKESMAWLDFDSSV